MGKLASLFHPRGVAVVGASRDLTRGGGQPVKALLDAGYAGRIYPINPKYDEIAGLRCYHSLGELDGPCDVVVIALPAAAVIDAVRECGVRKIGFAVIYGGGFREGGAVGQSLERKLLDVAHAGGVRLIGPNCLGIANITDNVYAAFGSLTREPRLKAGSVSMVFQSGGFGYTLVLKCAETGAGFRYLAASGNESDITTPELIDHYLDDPLTKIVISYVEGVSDGRALMAVGRKAAALGKPILLWKAGRKEQGLRAAASHTASMTGSYEIYSAALAQTGIVEVQSIDEVAALTQVFGSGRLPRGPRVGLLSASGGAAIVFADACDEEGVKIPPLADATVDAMRAFVPSMGSVSNPVDFAAGFLHAKTADKFTGALDLVLADDNIDQVCFMLATVQGEQALNGARIMAAAARHAQKPIMVFSSVPRATAEEALKTLEDAKIPVLSSPILVARAAAVTAAYAERVKRISNDAPAPRDAGLPQDRSQKRKVLNEAESKQLLADCGIPVTQELVVAAGQDIPFESIRYPVVVKVLSRELPHKSDVGGVRVNIRGDEELKHAFQGILRDVGHAAPSVKIEGMLVCEMVADALEVIVGVVNDEVFGPTVLLGLGGIFTEVMRDVVYRVAPFDVATAHEMIGSLRSSAVFHGVRGQAAYDIDALTQTISRVSEMAWRSRDQLAELDINPLFVRKAGQGVVVGDALAVMMD